MSKVITSQGKYGYEGKEYDFDFSFPVFDSIEDVIESLGETNTLKTVQRMVKVDAQNKARETARAKNGHSTRSALTEEEKAERKDKRAEDRKILSALKEKGLSLEDIASL